MLISADTLSASGKSQHAKGSEQLQLMAAQFTCHYKNTVEHIRVTDFTTISGLPQNSPFVMIRTCFYFLLLILKQSGLIASPWDINAPSKVTAISKFVDTSQGALP